MKALIGAHGTGKTTLLKELVKRNPSLVMSDGSSRPMKLIQEELGMTYEQYQIANNIFAIERHKQNHWQHNYITTRTLIDSWVYSYLAEMYTECDRLEHAIYETPLDGIMYFYLPIEFEVENDGVRSGDKEFQERCDIMMLEMLERCKIIPIKITGSVEARCKLIEKFL